MSDVSVRGTLAMASRNLAVYKRTWKVNALPPLAEPFLYLVAFGYGLGALIDQVEGVDYIRFIAPGIVAITMMQTAFMETTYAAYIRMVFQRTWDACLATPLSVDDVLWGEVLWAATRATINATLMCVVVGAFGLLSFPTAFLIPPIAFAVGMMFAGIGMFVSSKVKVIDQFSYAFFLFITPQFLLAGTFFPLSQLQAAHDAVYWMALALPLTHAVQLTRAAALGVAPEVAIVSIAYIVIAAYAVPAFAIGAMRRRIVT